MKTIKIYGASDDLIEIEGSCYGCDEYDVSGIGGPLIATFELESNGYAVKVYCIYDGCWSFAVTPQAEADEHEPWDAIFTFGKDKSYSQTVTIIVPDNTTVRHVE